MIDLHNHTYLCGHAYGQPSEYIECAIQRGITHFGFSDHAPLPDGLREGVTMRAGQEEEYLGMIIDEQKKYSGKIDILVGFEVDFPIRDTFNRSFFTDSRIDYLIGSCHYLEDWPVDHPEYIDGYNTRGIDNVYENYYKTISDLVKSNLFNIVGHFDLVKKFGHRSGRDFLSVIDDIAKLLHDNDTAVEINTSGLRKPVKEFYPEKKIIKILADRKVPITMGSDSHRPEEVGSDFEAASALLKELGVNRISYFKKRQRLEINL